MLKHHQCIRNVIHCLQNLLHRIGLKGHHRKSISFFYLQAFVTFLVNRKKRWVSSQDFKSLTFLTLNCHRLKYIECFLFSSQVLTFKWTMRPTKDIFLTLWNLKWRNFCYRYDLHLTLFVSSIFTLFVSFIHVLD